MAITNFIPELWSAQMLEVWWNESVFAALVNREYEGLAAKGNTVHISGVVAPSVKDYKAGVGGNARTTEAEAISDTGIDLLIDQEKNFDFYVDDIDRVQAAGSLESYTSAAGEGLTADSETFIANLLIAGGQSLSGAVPSTATAAFNLVRDARKELNKNKAPAANRVLAMNAEFEALLLDDASKLTAYDTSGDTNGLRQGTVGMLFGFRCVITNYMPAVEAPQFVAWQTRCAAFVSQMDQVEGMRAQNKFADRVRGLHVYGGKVVRPEGVVVFNKSGS